MPALPDHPSNSRPRQQRLVDKLNNVETLRFVFVAFRLRKIKMLIKKDCRRWWELVDTLGVVGVDIGIVLNNFPFPEAEEI